MKKLQIRLEINLNFLFLTIFYFGQNLKLLNFKFLIFKPETCRMLILELLMFAYVGLSQLNHPSCTLIYLENTKNEL